MNAARRPRFRIHDSASGRSRIIRRVATRDADTTTAPAPDTRMEDLQRRNVAFWAKRPNAARVPITKGDGDADSRALAELGELTHDAKTRLETMNKVNREFWERGRQ